VGPPLLVAAQFADEVEQGLVVLVPQELLGLEPQLGQFTGGRSSRSSLTEPS
jgi:hypothetical protein